MVAPEQRVALSRVTSAYHCHSEMSPIGWQ